MLPGEKMLTQQEELLQKRGGGGEGMTLRRRREGALPRGFPAPPIAPFLLHSLPPQKANIAADSEFVNVGTTSRSALVNKIRNWANPIPCLG